MTTPARLSDASSPHFAIRAARAPAAAAGSSCPVCGGTDGVALLWTVGPELAAGDAPPRFAACRSCRLELGNLLRRYDRPRRRLNKRHAAALVFLARNPAGRAARADVAAAAGKYATNTIASLLERGYLLELDGDAGRLLELTAAGWAEISGAAAYLQAFGDAGERLHASGAVAGAAVHASAEYSNAAGEHAAAESNRRAFEQLATFNRARRTAGL